MLLSRGFAVLAVATASSTMTMLTPLQATAQAAGQEVRYAWIDSCPKKEYTVPCGPWTLNLRDGKNVRLKDAVVFPKLANGRADKETSALLSISGDGRLVNYFRKSDGRLVVRDMAKGSVKALPGSAATLPKGLGMADTDTDTMFSYDGRRLVLDYFDEKEKLPSLIVDLNSQAISEIPGDETVQGFSPDGSHLLTSRTTNDNTTEFVVYDESGKETQSRVVPQIVSNNSPIALADDGVTIALVITGPSVKSKARLRTYDLSTDAVSDAVTLAHPPAEAPSRLAFQSAGDLALWTIKTNADGDVQSAARRSVNPDTGATDRGDSFGVKSGIWTWWLPAE